MKRGHSLDAEARLFHFPAQFAAAVTALMHRVFVNGAPKNRCCGTVTECRHQVGSP